jgi:hypothetical protein
VPLLIREDVMVPTGKAARVVSATLLAGSMIVVPRQAPAQTVPPVGPGVCVMYCGAAPTGGFGGVGSAMGMVGLGLSVLGLIQEMDQKPAPPQPPFATPPARQRSYEAAPPTNTPSATARLDAQKAAVLTRLRPLWTGSYAATDPSPPPTTSSAVEPQKVAILNQMRPLTPTQANSIGGTGISSGGNDPMSAQKAAMLQHMRPLNGADETISAKARAPFDTANPGSPSHSAADQLCQAAGAGNGCIGKFTPGQAGSTGPTVAPNGGTVAVATEGISLTGTRSRGLVCGAKLDVIQPVALDGMGNMPGRAEGFPIASSLDRLLTFDYSDIKANLAAMSPGQLARMKLAAGQEAARLEATIDALKVKLFASEIGAASPLDSLSDVAREAVLETAKDELPFWRQVEALAQKNRTKSEPVPVAEEYETVAKYLDQVDKSGDYLKKLVKYLDRVGRGSKPLKPQPPGFPSLEWAYGRSLVEGILATDAASNGDKSRASEHAANAAQALLPAAEWLVPEESLPFLVQWESKLNVSLVAVELWAHYREGIDAHADALQAQTASQALSLELKTRVDRLKGKLRDIQNLQQVIAQEPRCA